MSVIPNGKPSSSALVKPGLLGRTGRILFGLFLAWYSAAFLSTWIDAIQRGRITIDQPMYTGVVQKGNLALYALALLCLIAIPVATRRRRLIGASALLMVVAGIDYVFVGDWWGLPLAVLLSLIIVATLIFFALAHVLAGVIANPG